MDAVYEALKSRRIFGYELARQLGIPETRFRRILKGRVRARPDELRRIAEALKLDIEKLTPALSDGR